MYKKTLVGLFALSFSLQSLALETDWIELKKGSTDKATGATIREIHKPDNKGNTEVTVAIPKTAVADMKNTEEVVVYGKKESSKKGTPINVTYEWVADYEHDYYGLVIKFGKDPVLPLRLYLKATETNNIHP